MSTLVYAVGQHTIHGAADEVEGAKRPEMSKKIGKMLVDKHPPRVFLRDLKSAISTHYRWSICASFAPELPWARRGRRAPSAALAKLLRCRHESRNVRLLAMVMQMLLIIRKMNVHLHARLLVTFINISVMEILDVISASGVMLNAIQRNFMAFVAWS